jgi:hypothetical protein
VLDLPVPEVNRITVGGNTISIDAENYCAIYWYADGIRIFEGETIDLTEHQLFIYNYVRAAVVSYNYGVLYVQPFGVQIQGEELALNTLVSVDRELPEMVFPMNTPLTELRRMLPTSTRVETAEGPRNVVVIWDMASIDYDPEYADADQTFTLRGQIRYNQWLANPNRVCRDVTLEITVLGVAPCCDCCEDTDMCLSDCGTVERFIWSINEPRDWRVTQTGTNNHVLMLDGIGITEADIPALLAAEEIYLDIIYLPAGNNSNRRIIAWTDLSGAAEEVADITFATRTTLNDGKIAWTPARIVAGEPSARIPMPVDLLYDAATGRIAETVYVILTVDNIDEAAEAGGNRGANEFIRFDNIKLSLAGNYTWTADGAPLHSSEDGRAADVEYIDGDFSNAQGGLLRLANIGLGGIVPTEDAVITFTFASAQTGNRRLNVWTDLSGAGANSRTFASMNNVEAGLIAQSAQVAGETLEVTIPAVLLYDADTGVFADTIYVMCSLALTSDPFGSADFRVDVTNITLSAVLSVTGTVSPAVTAVYEWDSFEDITEFNEASNRDNDSSVLRLTIDLDIIPSSDSLLVFNFVENPVNWAGNAVSTNRAFNVWTNLSGAAAEVGTIAFANHDNFNAGKIVRTNQLTGARDTVSVVIPAELLYDAATGTFATEIYVFCTLASTDNHFEAGSHRSDLLRVIDEVILTVTNVDLCNCE